MHAETRTPMAITNMQLNDRLVKLDERVQKLEVRMGKSDDAIEQMNEKVDSLLTVFQSAKFLLAVIGSIIGPAITALIVLAIQHVWK